MKVFWHHVIKPLLEAMEPRRVIEIGCDRGAITLPLLRWSRTHGVALHSIDPVPSFDVSVFDNRTDEKSRFHCCLSLDILPSILPADVVLIDGDHNWYTVFHELRILYGTDQRNSRPP